MKDETGRRMWCLEMAGLSWGSIHGQERGIFFCEKRAVEVGAEAGGQEGSGLQEDRVPRTQAGNPHC